jgi:hypothetical protein
MTPAGPFPSGTDEMTCGHCFGAVSHRSTGFEVGTGSRGTRDERCERMASSRHRLAHRCTIDRAGRPTAYAALTEPESTEPFIARLA